MTVAADQPFIIFGSPLIEQAEIDEVVACMQSSWLGTGPRVAQFEQDFAAYQKLEAAQVAAVNSCTAALHVSLLAAGLEPGSEVITTPLTFCASVNAIIHSGLTPVLADVDPNTQCILLVEQDTQCVELYRRDNDWQVEYFEDGDIPLGCLEMALPVADIYVDVQSLDAGGG